LERKGDGLLDFPVQSRLLAGLDDRRRGRHLDAFQSVAATTLESLEKTVFGFASHRAFNYVRGRRITPRAVLFS
jgi:hypothetical protein